MAEIIVDGGRKKMHVAMMFQGGPEAIRVIQQYLPFKYKMPCGHTYELTDIDDLPAGDLPCPCGDPEHWFVKYEKAGSDG